MLRPVIRLRSIATRLLAVLVIVAVRIVCAIHALTLFVRILLRVLGLGSGDDPEIVFGVLEIVFRADRIAGRLGVTGELHVFLGDMRGGPADFDIRTVALIAP